MRFLLILMLTVSSYGATLFGAVSPLNDEMPSQRIVILVMGFTTTLVRPNQFGYYRVDVKPGLYLIQPYGLALAFDPSERVLMIDGDMLVNFAYEGVNPCRPCR